MGYEQDRKGTNVLWRTAQKLCFPPSGQNTVRQHAEGYCWCWETLWALSWKPTSGLHSSPHSCSATMVRYRGPGARGNSPTHFKEFRLLILEATSCLFVKPLNEQRSQTQCLTSNFPPSIILGYNAKQAIPPESCLGHVCAAKGNSLRHLKQVEPAGSRLFCLYFTFSVPNFSRNELERSKAELESELSAISVDDRGPVLKLSFI